MLHDSFSTELEKEVLEGRRSFLFHDNYLLDGFLRLIDFIPVELINFSSIITIHLWTIMQEYS